MSTRRARGQRSLTIVLGTLSVTICVALVVWKWKNQRATKSDNDEDEDESTSSDLFVKPLEPMDKSQNTASDPSQKNSKKPLTLDDLLITTTTELFSSSPTSSATGAGAPTIKQDVAVALAAASDQQQALLAPDPASLPTTISRSCVVQSVPTLYFVQVFADRLLLGISQLQNGRIGNYMLCEAIPSELNPRDVDYQVTSLLGTRDDTLLSVIAEQLTARILASNRQNSRPGASSTIILGISLHKTKGKDPEMFRAVVDLLVKLYEEAVSSGSTSP